MENFTASDKGFFFPGFPMPHAFRKDIFQTMRPRLWNAKEYYSRESLNIQTFCRHIRSLNAAKGCGILEYTLFSSDCGSQSQDPVFVEPHKYTIVDSFIKATRGLQSTRFHAYALHLGLYVQCFRRSTKQQAFDMQVSIRHTVTCTLSSQFLQGHKTKLDSLLA
jgi:hypothetical protein